MKKPTDTDQHGHKMRGGEPVHVADGDHCAVQRSDGRWEEQATCRLCGTAMSRPAVVAYHPSLAGALGSAKAAILLSQLMYWMPRRPKSVSLQVPKITSKPALTLRV